MIKEPSRSTNSATNDSESIRQIVDDNDTSVAPSKGTDFNVTPDSLVNRLGTEMMEELQNFHNQVKEVQPNVGFDDAVDLETPEPERHAFAQRERPILRRTTSIIDVAVKMSKQDIHRQKSEHIVECESDEIVEDEEENEDNEDEIIEKIAEYKNLIVKIPTMPWRMRKKLEVIKAAKAYLIAHEGRLSKKKTLRSGRLTKMLSNAKREMRNFFMWFVPWEGMIRQVESRFGSAVASYFVFLRWIFFDSVITAVIVLTLIILPEIILNIDLHGVIERKRLPLEAIPTEWDFSTIYNFGGHLQVSVLYYGYYYNESKHYNIPLAYLLVMLVVFCFGFVRILRKMAKNSRQNRISSDEEQYSFAWKLWCTWDFMIGNAETAANKKEEIANGFLELIVDAQEAKKVLPRSVILKRFLANLLVLVLLTGSFAIVYWMAQSETSVHGEPNFWDENALGIVLSIITALCPALFEIIGMMEQFHPRVCLMWQLGRILALYMINFYALIFGFYFKYIAPAAIAAKHYDARMARINNASTTVTSRQFHVSIPTTHNTSVLDSFSLATTISPISNLSNVNLFDSTAIPTTLNLTMLLLTLLSQNLTAPLLNSSDFLPLSAFEKFQPETVTRSTTLATTTQTPQQTLPILSFTWQNGTLTMVGGSRNGTNSSNPGVPHIAWSNCTQVNESLFCPTLRPGTSDLPYSLPARSLRQNPLCWEDNIAKEMYKLTVIDLLSLIISLLLVDFFRGLCVRYVNPCWFWNLETKFPEYGEFKIADNILHLIYNQGMVWMGTFFSPGLPLLNLVKLMIMVYFRSWALMACNIPLERVFTLSQNTNTFYMLLLFMLFLCMLPTLYLIIQLRPSPICGPFSGDSNMFNVLQRTIASMPVEFQAFADYIVSPGIILPVSMCFIMAIYYLVSSNQSLQDVNQELRHTLRYERTEGRQKVFSMADKAKNVDKPLGADVLGQSAPAALMSGLVEQQPPPPPPAPISLPGQGGNRPIFLPPAQAMQFVQIHQMKVQKEILELRIELERARAHNLSTGNLPPFHSLSNEPTNFTMNRSLPQQAVARHRKLQTRKSEPAIPKVIPSKQLPLTTTGRQKQQEVSGSRKQTTPASKQPLVGQLSNASSTGLQHQTSSGSTNQDSSEARLSSLHSPAVERRARFASPPLPVVTSSSQSLSRSQSSSQEAIRQIGPNAVHGTIDEVTEASGSDSGSQPQPHDSPMTASSPSQGRVLVSNVRAMVTHEVPDLVQAPSERQMRFPQQQQQQRDSRLFSRARFIVNSSSINADELSSRY